MADKGDISLVVSADTTPLEQALEKATGLVNSKMEDIGSSVKSQLAGVAEAFAAAFAVKELADFVNGVAEAQAHIQQLSETTGTSVANLSAIAGVAKVVGANIDDVAGAMEKLVRGLATGDGETGKAANALAYLGISARNSDGSLRDAGDLYQAIAAKFADIGNGAGKTALAIDLFGKAGAAQIPILNALGEAGGGVAKLTDQQALAAENYERDLNRLSIQLQANKKVIATELIPVLDDCVRALLDVITNTNGLTGAAKGLAADGSIQEFGRDAALVLAAAFDAGAKLVQMFKAVGLGVVGVGEVSIAVLSGDMKRAGEIASQLDDEVGKVFSGPTLEERLRKQFALSDEAKKIDFGNSAGSWDKANYTGTGKKPKKEDDSKALLAVQRAEFEAEANLAKEYAKEDEQTNDDLYKHNLISIEDYFAQKTALQQQGIAAQIASKESEIEAAEAAMKTAQTEKERLGIQAQMIKLSGELAVLNAQSANVEVVNSRAATDALRQKADAMRQVAIASQVNVGNAGVEQDRLAMEQRKALHKESDADAIQEEIDFENRLTDIKRNALLQQRQLELNGTHDPVKIAELDNQIEELELQHQQKLTLLSNEGELERNKYALAASDAIKDNFTTFFEDLTDRTKKLSDTFKNLFQGIQKSINDQLSKQLTDQIMGSGTKGGGILGSILGSIFPGSAPKAPAPSAAAPAGNDVAGLAALDSAAASTSTSLTGLQDTGIGGMLKGAKDWIAQQVLGKTATAAQNVSQETATTSMTTFIAAVDSATQALARMATTGGAGGSASAANDVDFGGGDDNGFFGALFDSVGSFAVGTDFVPQDMLAMIHKGERIVPAKYNNDSRRQTTNHLTINVPKSTSRATASQVATAALSGMTAAARRNS